MKARMRMQSEALSNVSAPFTPVRNTLLQRKCACGGSAGLDGTCEACRNKRLSVQRSALNSSARHSILPIMHDVLRSSGQPLTAATRAFMEPSFGHDFSQVRVHTGRQAVDSVRAVNAFAYTVGRNIVFGAGQYAPGTHAGKRLLAHELTHVVQQQKAPHTILQSKSIGNQADNANEHEAEAQAATLVEGRGAAAETSSSGPSAQADHLTSPRFAGNEKLEACFQNRDRLRQGDHGEAVVKVQQALVDLDYDLGTTGEGFDGVDGDYGQKTAAAVRSFKANHHLGFEQYGDVGPGTMHNLDILFPTVRPQPPTALKDEPLACPFQDDEAVQGAVEQVGAHGLLAASVLGQVGIPPTGVASGHLLIAETVTRFKQAVNATIPPSNNSALNVPQGGQFFWTERVETDILAELDNMRSDTAAARFVTRAKDTINAIITREGPISTLITELDRMAATTKSPLKPRMLALLGQPPASGVFIENQLWATLNKDPLSLLPNLGRFRSLRTLRVIYDFVSGACGDAALKLVERLKKRGGIKPVAIKAPRVNAFLAAGTAIRDVRPGLDPGTLLGDVIDQKGVDAAVAQMKLALDGGRQVHARVLSGVGYGHEAQSPNPKAHPVRLSKPPPEEHSLVIIGFDGDSFVFADPDAHVSHTPEKGFGMLFFDATEHRLSTAPNRSGLFVTPEGAHKLSNDKRYQIISLASFE